MNLTVEDGGWIQRWDSNGVCIETVARPFVVWSSENAKPFEEDTPIEVSDKIDGRLGILYPDSSQPTGFAVATQNSFTDDSARFATEAYQKVGKNWNPRPGFTYLFEIVSPLTKGYVNYGGDENIYLIGIVGTDTGHIVSVRHPHVSIPRTYLYSFGTFGEFQSKWKPAPGTEGVVVRNLNTGVLVKFQTEGYLAWKEAR